MTYQYVVCLSSSPRKGPYPDRNPLPDILNDVPAPPIDAQAEGEATIEVSLVFVEREQADGGRHILLSSIEMELLYEGISWAD